MDRVRVLAELDRRILEAYSRRTTQALRGALPLRLALPHLEPLLARNVAKEVRKDALVIRCAGDALAAGARPGQDALEGLLAQGRAIDGDFLARVGKFPIGIVVRYEEILPLRRQRIERLLGCVVPDSRCLALRPQAARGAARVLRAGRARVAAGRDAAPVRDGNARPEPRGAAAGAVAAGAGFDRTAPVRRHGYGSGATRARRGPRRVPEATLNEPQSVDLARAFSLTLRTRTR